MSSSPSAAAEAKQLREQGNQQFQSGQFEGAAAMYSQALALLLRAGPSALAGDIATVLSNRSACFLSLDRLSEAETDARNALSMDAANIKAHFRLGKSLFLQNKLKEALKAIEVGLKVDSQNKPLLTLKIDCEKKSKADRKAAFLNGSNIFGISTCCDDTQNSICFDKITFCGSCGETVGSSSLSSQGRDVPAESARLAVAVLKLTIKALITKDSQFFKELENTRPMGFDNTFRSLCDPSQFKSLIYPGFPDYVTAQMPSTVRDLLAWRELKLDLMDVACRAVGVLENVKRKGADRGDVMDAPTEAFLMKQIVNEQLARDLITAVRRFSRSLSAIHASLALKVAPTDCDEALRDQLEDDVPSTLLSKGMLVQEEYMGDEWAALVMGDVLRYAKDEKLTLVDDCNLQGYFANSSASGIEGKELRGASISYLEADKVKDLYPAIHELLNQLHALPFEINSKSDSKLQLLEPGKGSTMLIRFPPGSGQNMRWDNLEVVNNQSTGTEEAQAQPRSGIDSLIRLTCSYHLVPPSGPRHPSIYVHSIHDGTPGMSTLPPSASSRNIENDQLVVHRSTKLQNGRTAAEGEYFAIIFYIHGRSWG